MNKTRLLELAGMQLNETKGEWKTYLNKAIELLAVEVFNEYKDDPDELKALTDPDESYEIIEDTFGNIPKVFSEYLTLIIKKG